jgi:hypothetical protein
MSKITSEIKPGTNDLKIRISYLSAPSPVIAVYDFKLKISDANPPLLSFSGDNQNSADDIYTLPYPAQSNKGRYVLLQSNVGATDTDADFTIKTEVIQDGTVTDTVLSEGKVLQDGEAVLKIDMIKFI